MSIEGDRNKAGMFSEGEILSATKLNALGDLAGYGKQWHSSGAQVIQGGFGTVQMSEMAYEEYDADQFGVSVSKEGDNLWFTINPGYVTVTDMNLPFLGFHFNTGEAETKYVDGKGMFSSGECYNGFVAERQDMGINRLYYVDSCNAFGAKKNSGKSNKLTENSFRPDVGASPITIIFLYRSTPGFGIPKLGVMNLSTFNQHFANNGTSDDMTKFYTNPYFQSATIGAAAQLTTQIRYRKVGVVLQVDPDVITGGISVLEDFPSYASFNKFVGIGLYVQVLAFYDNRENGKFTEVNRGHSWMTNPSIFVGTDMTDVTVYPGPPPNPPLRAMANYGWHSYYYTNSEASSITGLTFENAPFTKNQPPYFFS